MSESSLVSYTKISPNKTSPRTHTIDTITIHCYVGQVSVESAGSHFADSSAQASCNYVIGTDGRIGLIVSEADRSWCSSNADNDHRAITIECASDKTDPYAINDKVYASLIDLCADICKRNKIEKLLWKADKSLIGQVDKQNMTVHRWFANKACPGDYIYSRLGQIADEVNAKLGVTDTSVSGTVTTGDIQSASDLPETPFYVSVLIDDLNYRSEPSMSGTVKGQTGKGTFTIVETSGGWGKLKSGAGWIYLLNSSYCSYQTALASDDSGVGFECPFQVHISASDLNIRKGPGTDYDKTGKYTGVGTFTITEVSDGKGSTAGWGKLKSCAGWISLDYASVISVT